MKDQTTPETIVADLMDRVKVAAEKRGVLPSTIINRATGNAHLHKRIERKAKQLASDIAKIEAYLAEIEKDADE